MATMNIIQAMNRLRSDIQTWVANNLRVKVNTELKTGSTEEYKVLSDNNFTDADKNKLDSAITGITPGLGLAGGVSNGVATLNIGAGIGIAVDADTVAVNIQDSTKNSKASVKGGNPDKLYAVELDTNGDLAVSVPWTATTIEGNEELEELLSGYKTRQPVKSSPTATNDTSTEFIDTISQDANGVITATKKKLPTYTNVTENTVSGWGFTKNAGTVTSVKINGSTKTPTNGVVDLGTISGGISINVDDTVSTTSTNPVQNKIVTAYIDSEVERAIEYAEEVANDAEAAAKTYTDNAIANLPSGGGSSNGFEIRIFKEGEDPDTLQYNRDSIALIKQNKAVGAINIVDGDNQVTLISETNMILYDNFIGCVTVIQSTSSEPILSYGFKLGFAVTASGLLDFSAEEIQSYQFAKSPLVVHIKDAETIQRHIAATMMSALTGTDDIGRGNGSIAVLITEYGEVVCDRSQAGDGGWIFEYNADGKRFRSLWNADTGEEISTTEIPVKSALIINSDVNFKPASDTGGTGSFTSPGVTLDDVKNAVNNKIPIILAEPSGDTNYCVRTDYSDNSVVLHFLNNYDNLLAKPFQYTIIVTVTSAGFAYTARKTQLQEKLTSGTNIKTINGVSLLGSGDITVTEGGESITVDAELSSTSTNPVQNKIVKAAIDDAIATAKDYTDELVGDIKALLIEINGEEV